MKFENRTPREGINVSREHPLKEFSILLAGLAGIVILIAVMLSFIAEMLAPLVPFRLEEKLLAGTELEFGSSDLSEDDLKVERYLQQLGSQLAAQMDIPEDMTIRIHYDTGSTVNAYASLGGNVVIYRGLLERLPHENSLAMVVAHEIAHIKERHPIVSTGRGITVALALLSLTGITDSGAVTNLIGQIGVTTTLGFSRKQERAADREAMQALQRHYGHLHGADALFTVLDDATAIDPPELLSTHPASDDRIANIERAIAEQAAPNQQLTALPAYLEH